MYNLGVYPAENIWREWKTGVILRWKEDRARTDFNNRRKNRENLIRRWTFWTVLLLGKSWWRFRRPRGRFIPSACEVVSPCDSLPCPERALSNLKAPQKRGVEKLPRGPQMRLFRCVRRYPTDSMSWRYRKEKSIWGSPLIWSYEKIFVTLSNARRQGEPSDTFILYRPDLERCSLTIRCLTVLQTYLQDRMVHPRQPEIGGKTRQSADNPP